MNVFILFFLYIDYINYLRENKEIVKRKNFN